MTSLKEKYHLWKLDLDRTQGNSLEAILGRRFDRIELRTQKSRYKAVHNQLKLIQIKIDNSPSKLLFQRQILLEKELEYYSRKISRLEAEIQSYRQKKKEYYANHQFEYPVFLIYLCQSWKRWKAKFTGSPVYHNPPGIKSILVQKCTKRNHIRRDSKLEFSEQVQEVEYELEVPSIQVSTLERNTKKIVSILD